MKDYSLFNKLNKEVELGNVRRSEFEDLYLYKYSEDCAFNKNWNEWNRQARGIIFRKDAEIVARPFSKFFNLFEMPETMPEALPRLPYEVQEKVDGSCGSAFRHNGAWRLATPGAFESEQALYGTELLKKYNWDVLPLDVTPIFEIVYPGNRIVIDYNGEEFLSLLAIFEKNGQEWHSSRVDQIAHQGRFKRPRYYTIDPLNAAFEENTEGYVVRYENGFRLKIKSPIYSQIHKLLGYLSPKGVIELLQGKEYGITIKQLPPAIAKSFDDIRGIVTGKYYEFTNEVERLFTLVPEGTKKDKALWVQTNVPRFLQGQVFAKINGKDISYKMWNIVLENL